MPSKPVIAIVGTYQNGKSSLINCLLDDPVARTGTGVATTHLSVRYSWGELSSVELTPKDPALPPQFVRLNKFLDDQQSWHETYAGVTVSLWKPLLAHVDIVDTPGFNFDDGDSEAACRSLDEADFALLVLENRQMSQNELAVFDEIKARWLPFSVIMNCKPQGNVAATRDPASPPNVEWAHTIQAQMARIELSPVPISGVSVAACNLIWYWYATGHPDERIETEVENHFYDRKTKNLSANFLEISTASGFHPIRNYFQNQLWHLFAPGNAQVRSSVSRSFRQWKKSLDQLQGALKTTRPL